MIIKDCEFYNNTSDDSGGAIYAKTFGYISIEGGVFEGNKAH